MNQEIPKVNSDSDENSHRGRPTIYSPELVDELIEWFHQTPWEEIELPHYGREGEIKWVDKKRMARALPTLQNFARDKKIAISTLYSWINPNSPVYKPEFMEAYTRVAKECQKEFLIQNGLQGIFNPIFTKFVAVNLTDMKEKQEIDLTSEIIFQVTGGSSEPPVENPGVAKSDDAD